MVLVLDAEATTKVKMVNVDAFCGQLLNQGQNPIECLNKGRWVE